MLGRLGNQPPLIGIERLVLYRMNNLVVERCYCPDNKKQNVYLVIVHLNDSDERVEWAFPTYKLAKQWLEHQDTERFRNKWYGRRKEQYEIYWYIKTVTMFNELCNYNQTIFLGKGDKYD